MRMSGKLGYVLLFTSLSLYLPCISVQAISSEQIVMSKQQFNLLENNNKKALNEIRLSKIELRDSQKIIDEQQRQLELVKKDLNEQKNYLEKANESLQKYEKEIKRERRILKLQRDGYALLAIVLGVVAIK